MAYMTNEEKNVEELNYIIPTNVNARYEVIPGFGKKEVIYLLLSVILGVALLLGLGTFKKTEYVKTEDLEVYQTVGLSEEELSKDVVEIKKEVVSPPIRLIAAVTPPAIVYLLFKTDSMTNISFYEQLSYKRNYDKRQKRYLYTRNID